MSGAKCSRLAIGPLWGVIFALAGGLAAWALIGALIPAFPEVSWPAWPSDEVKARLTAAQARIDCSNQALAMGILGAVLGAAMAIGEGVVRRSLGTALVGGVILAIAGALAGGLAGLVGHTLYQAWEMRAANVPLVNTLVMHAAVLGTLGGGIGLGLGLLAHRATSAAVHLFLGILAGGLAGVFYPFLAGFCLPNVCTNTLIPEASAERLLWLGLATGLIGLIVPGTARK
jgi:hypothetical protein